MSNDTAQTDASHSPAVGAPLDRGVRPRALLLTHRDGRETLHPMNEYATAYRDTAMGQCLLYEAPRWVPVTERLPDKNTEVLICFAGQNTLCSTGQYTDSKHDVNGWCYPWENRGATDHGDDPVVTHWMPLPEPPPLADTRPNEKGNRPA